MGAVGVGLGRSRGRYGRQAGRLHRADRVLAELAPGAAAALGALGYKVSGEPLPHTTFHEVVLPKGRSLGQALGDFEALGGVADTVEFDVEAVDAWMPDEGGAPYAAMLPALSVLGAAGLWAWLDAYRREKALSPVSVAWAEPGPPLIGHPCLAGRFDLPGRWSEGQWFSDNSYFPEYGHATRTVSVCVARPVGFLAYAGLASLVAKAFPVVSQSSVSRVAAVGAALDRGCRVINFSQYGEFNGALEQAFAAAKAANVVVCVSSGNVGQNSDNEMARYASVLSICGCGAAAPTYHPGAVYNEGVDFFAPYTYPVLSEGGGGLSYGSGTSFSAPIASSLFALMFSLDPSLTWGDAVGLAARHCAPIQPPPSDPQMALPWGYGVPQFVPTLAELGAGSCGFYGYGGRPIRQVVAMGANGAVRYGKAAYARGGKQVWAPSAGGA